MGRSRSTSRSPRHKHKSKHSHKRSRSKDKRDRNLKSKKSHSRERSRSRLSKVDVGKLDTRHLLDNNKKRKRSHSSSSSSSSSDGIDGLYSSHRRRLKKMNEVERLAEMERLRRQKELESKLVEEETSKRIEEIVAKRVEEELEKRKDDIEKEVLRRVEEAKKIMEKEMLLELERRQKMELEAQKAKEMAESGFFHCPSDKEPDLVQCYVCYKELDGWQADDEPWDEHYSHSKICVFAQIKKPQKDLTIAEIYKIEAERKFNKIKRLLAQRKQQFNSRCDEIEEFINTIYDSIGET